MNEELNSIADELYNLNENLQGLMFLIADLMGRPLEHLTRDGFFEFEKEDKNKK